MEQSHSSIKSYIQSQWENNKMRDHLARWVACPSVSGSIEYRDEVHKMLEIAKHDFTTMIDAHMWIVPNPLRKQYTQDGDEIKLPGILLGNYPKKHDSRKKTILIYGHLDVQPALMADGWDTDPWKLTEIDGKLYGRGSSDDKAPILGFLYSIMAIRENELELPVNLKFCFEGMEESASVGLKECLFQQNKDFFSSGIQGTVICDNYWLGTKKPCLTYGLRGACSFSVTVESASKDLHSGVFGGAVHEAITDLIHILHSLVDNKGRVKIDDFYELVDPVTEEEASFYKSIDFDHNEFADSINGHLIHKTKEKTLMSRWREPTLTIHGIEGAHSGPEDKTVIPRRVNGKFSVRTVGSMTTDDTIKKVKKHVQKVTAELDTPNRVWLSRAIPISPTWSGDPNSFLFTAARKATKTVYEVDPDLTREGCSIPITIDFEKATRSPTILIPMGAGDDGAHSQNEKIDVRNYVQGTKLLACFLMELGASSCSRSQKNSSDVT